MEKPKKMTKTVKIPVTILEADEDLRKVKFKAFDKVLYEGRTLGNYAIRYAIAGSLGLIPEEVNPKTGKAYSHNSRIEQLVREKRKYVNAGSNATLVNNFATRLFRTANKETWNGKKSLPTYRSPFVVVRHTGTKITTTEGEKETQFVIEPAGFSKYLTDELIEEVGGKINPAKRERGLTLVSRFSWKDQGSRAIVQRIINGEYTLGDFQVQKIEKKNKLPVYMIFAPYSFEPAPVALDPGRVCGIDIGINTPVVCALNDGPEREYIGTREEIWAARARHRAMRRRKQRGIGFGSKSVKWETSKKELNWINTYCHTVTKRVIKFCLKHNCGTLHMEDLTRLRQEDMENGGEYKRLIWVPAKLRGLLEYKCDELGIEIVPVNPRNTSRRCAACGHVSKDNRISQREFVCEECGDPKKPVHADYNAARNIALAAGEVIDNGYSPIEGTR